MEPDDLERAIFFERARDEAEQAVEKDSNDASALTRWGGALLELAHFRQGHDAFDMIDQASSDVLPCTIQNAALEALRFEEYYQESPAPLQLSKCKALSFCGQVFAR